MVTFMNGAICTIIYTEHNENQTETVRRRMAVQIAGHRVRAKESDLSDRSDLSDGAQDPAVMHPCVLSELSELSALSDRPRPQYRLRAMCPAATRVSITPAQRGGRDISKRHVAAFPKKVFPSSPASLQYLRTEPSRRILARMASRRAASGRAQATTNQQVICSRLFRKSRMAVFQAAVSSE